MHVDVTNQPEVSLKKLSESQTLRSVLSFFVNFTMTYFLSEHILECLFLAGEFS